MTRVLVTDAGRGSALSIVRALERRGIEVVAADVSRRSPAFVSRSTSGRVVYPHPAVDARGAVDTLVAEAKKREIDLVIPVGEDLVVLLSAERDRFDGSARLALPHDEALAAARDKRATVELAERLDVPAPRTALVETAAEAVRAAADFRPPIVLKPRASRSVRDGGTVEPFGVAYASGVEELAEAMRPFEQRCAVLLQEYYGGEGHGVGLLMDRGSPLLAFQHRRLREVPFTGGPSSFRESVALDPTLYDYSTRLLGELGWTGPAMVEFKVGRDGPSLMEINGRIWGSLALAVKSGVDLPARMVDLYLTPRPDAPAAPDLSYSVGVRSRDLGLELNWIASVLRGRTAYPFLAVPSRSAAISAALRLVDPRDGFDVLSVRDPLPGLVEVANVAGKVFQHLTPRRSRGSGSAAGTPTPNRRGSAAG